MVVTFALFGFGWVGCSFDVCGLDVVMFLLWLLWCGWVVDVSVSEFDCGLWLVSVCCWRVVAGLLL